MDTSIDIVSKLTTSFGSIYLDDLSPLQLILHDISHWLATSRRQIIDLTIPIPQILHCAELQSYRDTYLMTLRLHGFLSDSDVNFILCHCEGIPFEMKYRLYLTLFSEVSKFISYQN